MIVGVSLTRSRWFRVVQVATFLCLLVWYVSVTTATATTSTTTTTTSESLFLLCTADGSLYVVEAWNGNFQQQIATEALISRSHAAAAATAAATASSTSSQENSVLVPGLDGRLYWHDGQALQAMPLTIQSLLENPVQSCNDGEENDNNNQECGILTATVETSLVALDAHGRLVWNKQQPTTTVFHERNDVDDDDESTTRTDTTQPPLLLLLQRKDYRVQQVSSRTGTQAWNVSLGTWQALDFGLENEADDKEENARVGSEDDDVSYTLSSQHHHHHHHDRQAPLAPAPRAALLPSIVFLDTGRTVLAVDPHTRDVLWKMETEHVVASIFGIHQGRWKAVQVVAESDLQLTLPKTQFQLAASASESSNKEDLLSDLLWSTPEWYQLQLRAQEQQQQRRRQESTLRLPSYTAPFQEVCVNGDCPNLRHMQLQLPAPSSASTVYTPDGLLLSWRIVGALVCFVCSIIVGGRVWYLRKKQTWLMKLAVSTPTASTTATTPQSLNGLWKGRNGLKRSASLPEGFAGPTPAANRRRERDKTPMKTMIAHSEENGTPLTETAVTPLGEIPLVRYSRYASEFSEIEPMGKGGFGTVFKCRNTLDGREYAVKKVSIQGTTDDQSFQQRLQRVLREVKILAVLDHPNIVRYYTAWLEIEHDDVGVDDEESTSMSHCYSSSLLTESVSQWPTLPKKSAAQVSPMISRNPLGWKGNLSEDHSVIPRRSVPRANSLEDYGFIFEASEEDDEREQSKSGLDEKASQSLSARCDTSSHEHSLLLARSFSPKRRNESSTQAEEGLETSSTPIRHMLYIQMQLCSQRTVHDFLSDATARTSGTEKGMDIPTALRLFLQVAQAVKHVHFQNLIHRDLKPSNCFMDESGIVKVGDFGLSRESNDRVESTRLLDALRFDDHTAGVGTRAYASPEQMNGSDYDSSTDVYSLGIMLFELCYPMYTGMERNICLSRLRDNQFPMDWDVIVGGSFPTLRTLIQSMLSPCPSERPNSEAVVQHIQSILSEFTILSLDQNGHLGQDIILLRVETEHRADALDKTLQAIHESAADKTLQVVQYGLRSSTTAERSVAIMEFAVKYPGFGSDLVSKLRLRPEIHKVRQVTC